MCIFVDIYIIYNKIYILLYIIYRINLLTDCNLTEHTEKPNLPFAFLLNFTSNSHNHLKAISLFLKKFPKHLVVSFFLCTFAVIKTIKVMMNASKTYTNDTLATSRKPAAIIAPAIA